MRPNRIFLTLALVATAPAVAAEPQFNAPALIPHVQEASAAEQTKTPYAMNYTDEAAQSLGVKDGKWEAFTATSSSPILPSLNAGADSGGAMIKLQWR